MLIAIKGMFSPAFAQNPGHTTGAIPPTSMPPPAWAFPWDSNFKPAPDDGLVRRVPNSSVIYALPQLRDRFFAPDWHPDDHPPMPEVVARGRKPDVFACAFCHRADGPGGPENASLAGLPATYIAQQMADFKSGARKTSVPKRNVDLMISLAKAATDEEVQAAAVYFSNLKRKPILKVIETEHVPKTFVVGMFLAPAASGGQEPIGQRIVEVPQDLEQFEHRDARAQFIAYVPPGSVGKGERLAQSGQDGKTMPCAGCHGTNLGGLNQVPGIAGRSPSYIVRQLYDFMSGARGGDGAAQMRPVVEKLSADDMISLAAYLASLPP